MAAAAANASLSPKAHTAALALLAPLAAWPAIQRIRCARDKSFVRWPPHINLLYPFHADAGGSFEAAAQRAARAVAGTRPFALTLSQLRFFEHGRSCTVWVEPSAPEMQQVQALLAAEFPQCNDLSHDPKRGITGFTPHLSLGQWRTAAEAQAAMQELAHTWEPITFTVDEVALISRQGFDSPFTTRYVVPLGGEGAPRCMDIPYVATVGEAHRLLSSVTGARARYGFGASPVLYNFAYGANINPGKLSAARQLHPLSSKPALLRGYRLAFNHRGGFGNLVPLAPGEAAPPGGAVHGVLHAFSPEDMGRLANMEHEYLPTEVEAEAYDGSGPHLAVAFITHPSREIREGLPPPQRYLNLIQEGARHWQLEGSYAAWLESLRSTDASAQRGPEYYASPQMERLEVWPKIRTGSQQSRGRSRGRGRGGLSRPPRGGQQGE